MKREDLIKELEKVLDFVKESSDKDINMFVNDSKDHWSLDGISVDNSSIVCQLVPNCYIYYEPYKGKDRPNVDGRYISF